MPAITFEPFLQRLQLHRLAVEAQGAGEVGLEALVAGHLVLHQLVELTGESGAVGVVGALGEGVEAIAGVLGVAEAGVRRGLLGGCDRVRLVGGLGRCLLLGAVVAGARGSLGLAVGVGADELEVRRRKLLLLLHRIDVGDLAELGIGEAVAVSIAQGHVATELLRLADVGDDAVVDRDDRRALAGEDVDPSTCG